MIAVDTSALMVIVLGEAEADACIKILEAETEVLISAGVAIHAGLICLNGPEAMDLDLQLEPAELALDDLVRGDQSRARNHAC